MNKYDELKTMGFRFDHAASQRGYISRKIDYKIVPYIGRFGIGVKVIFPRADTTQYVNIEYHILDEGVLYCQRRNNCIAYRYNFDHFKNHKTKYEFSENDRMIGLTKGVFTIKLKEWDYLCN